MSKEYKLRCKNSELTLNGIRNIIDNILKLPLNTKASKTKKHNPFSVNDIENITTNFKDNILAIKFKNNPNEKYYFNNKSYKKKHSFCLSNKTNKEHIDYITEQLGLRLNQLSIYLDQSYIQLNEYFGEKDPFDLFNNGFNEVYKDIKHEFNTEHKTNFEIVLAINIFPKDSYITNNNNIKIAVLYIVAVSKDKILNIIFEDTMIFNNIYGSKNLQKQILEYNNSNIFNIKDIFYISENLGLLCPETFFGYNNVIYEQTIPKINDHRIIKEIKVVNNDDEILDAMDELHRIKSSRISPKNSSRCRFVINPIIHQK